MDDPRFTRWLEITESALEVSDAELVDQLTALETERAEIRESVESNPPTEPLSESLVERLTVAEDTLHQRVASARGSIESAFTELRKVRAGTQGYRPARSGLPAFVSKNV